MKQFNNKYALVTGASSGLGRDFARLLGNAGCHLILVARREERLVALRDEISAVNNVEVTVIAKDLSSWQSAEELYLEVEQAGLKIDVLINNAGFGLEGAFYQQDWERQHQMMALNMDTLTYLSKRFSEKMVANGGGYILLVSSVGGFTPCPGLAIYDATKAYVLVLGETLHYELKDKGVVVTTMCPGATETEFFEVSGQELSPMIRMTMMGSEAAARIALKGLAKGKSLVVPSIINKLAVWSMRLAPRRWMPMFAKLTIGASY